MEKMKFNLQLFGNGIIDGSSTASNCDCRIVWSSTKNDSNNTSNVTATVQIKKTGSSSTSGTFGGTITIDGTSYPVSKYGSWAWGDWRTVGSASKTVTHNENGTKAINISANLKQTGTSMAGTYTASGTATLDTINRASKLNVIDDFKLTDTITINITKYITTATDKLQIKLGDTLVKEINNITNGYELTFTSSEQTTIKNLMTSPQATLIFLLTTISGETTLGTSTQSATVTSLDKPVYRNVIKKENGHYQVAINGVVDTTINDVLQVYDDEGNEILNENVLYNNESGSNGTIALSETAKNFKYIEIIFRDNDQTYSSVMVYKPNEKFVDLTTLARWSSTFYIKQKRVAISGTSITPGNATEVQLTTAPKITINTSANNIYITRVVGYR